MPATLMPSPTRELLPWLIFALLSMLLAAVGPLPLPAHYHEFVDTRTLEGVPNALNVFSNVGFFVVGV